MMVEYKLVLAESIIVILLIIIALLTFVVFALNKQISELINKRFSEKEDNENNAIK